MSCSTKGGLSSRVAMDQTREVAGGSGSSELSQSSSEEWASADELLR